jgi:formylglycine-generating enzyme required for sulfatase activity
MFRCFLEAGGYAEERWWAEAREVGVWQPEGTVKDWLDMPRREPFFWEDVGHDGPNQPVVGVTWYEALAYCRWLTAKLADGYEYRLPTEAEWERAARGTVGYRYPWGNEWAENRANMKDLNLARATPVGIFPDGASDEGVLDLSGNVWEWCSSAYDKYPYDVDDGREDDCATGDRVVRGGGWSSYRHEARCAFRNADRRDFCSPMFGFRVARGQSR